MFEHEKKEIVSILLEIVLLNEEIVGKNSWNTIIDAVIFINSPYSKIWKVETKEDEKVIEISKKLAIEYKNSTEYLFLYKKYFGKKK